jgi:hypothetical protein
MDRKALASELVRLARELAGTKDELRDAVAAFLAENPQPTDDEFHAFAAEKKLDKHKAEAAAYALAGQAAKFWANGRSNKEGTKESEIDADELKMGIEVEQEHVPDEDMARRIALDHLAEIPDYYTRLKKMEEEGKKAKKASLRTAFFHPGDSLLRPISFQDVIDVTYSNERVRDARAVTKVFNELVNDAVRDARADLREALPTLVKMANEE